MYLQFAVCKETCNDHDKMIDSYVSTNVMSILTEPVSSLNVDIRPLNILKNADMILHYLTGTNEIALPFVLFYIVQYTLFAHLF